MHRKTAAIIAIILILTIAFSSCKNKNTEIKKGKWHCYLAIDEENPEKILPFFIDVVRNDPGAIVAEIRNAEERLPFDSVWVKGDSIFMQTRLFDTQFQAKLKGNKMSGIWVNNMRGSNYTIPFFAEYGVENRFPLYDSDENTADVSGKWQVTFGPETEDSWNAIGEFRQQGNKVTGTFLTETGDFRYLEGNIRGNELLLSAFDGSHAFLFNAKILPDNSLHGKFYSGKHWSTSWMAYKNPFAELADPEKLTYLKDDFDRIFFCFPNRFDEKICLADKRYKDKVVLIQIMGTWCPNCMDETALFAGLYENYHDRGLEIIALAFEKSNDKKTVYNNIEKLVKQYDIGYEVVWAGPASKEEANKVLPMLNNIISYPTTIFIDRTGEVQKIYTGFMGPGTGTHYEELVKDLKSYVEQLLQNE
jgi:thiol-disulfide isomerase/thioredoxin